MDRRILIPPPPRRIPLSTQLALLIDIEVVAGMILAAVAIGLWWFIFSESSRPIYIGSPSLSQGQVQRCQPASDSPNGSSWAPWRPVQTVSYTYRTPDGKLFSGESYTLAPCPPIGSTVNIEYDRKSPSWSHLPGAPNGARLWECFEPAIMLLPGLGLIFFRLVVNFLRLRTLRRGLLTTAETVSMSLAMLQTGSNRKNHAVMLAFNDQDGARRHATVITDKPHLLKENSTSSNLKKLLIFDPLDPERVLALDLLPPAILSLSGEFAPLGWTVWLRLLPPTALALAAAYVWLVIAPHAVFLP